PSRPRRGRDVPARRRLHHRSVVLTPPPPWQDVSVSSLDLLLVLRYRKAVTYGFHVLLGALEEHETAISYEVVFGDTPESTAAAISSGLERAKRVVVLWSFYSPDAEALAAELATIKAAAPGALHIAGGVH